MHASKRVMGQSAVITEALDKRDEEAEQCTLTWLLQLCTQKH